MTDTTSGSLDSAYRQTKLVLETEDRDFARTIAGALQDLIDPPPHALTLFEQGPSNWRIEDYYYGDADRTMLSE